MYCVCASETDGLLSPNGRRGGKGFLRAPTSSEMEWDSHDNNFFGFFNSQFRAEVFLLTRIALLKVARLGWCLFSLNCMVSGWREKEGVCICEQILTGRLSRRSKEEEGAVIE